MRIRSAQLVCTVTLLVLVLSGCFGGSKTQTPPSAPAGTPVETTAVTPTVDVNVAYTQAAETIVAELEHSASPTGAMAQAMPTGTPTEPPLPPTSTPLPTNTPLPSDTPTPTNTPTVTNTPVPSVSPTSTLPPEPKWKFVSSDTLKTGFWPRQEGETMSMHYKLGGYLITNDSPETFVWSARSDTYNGVRVEVTGRRVAGPIDGYYGIVCDFADAANYYLLAVGTDGWYGIGLKANGKLVFLAEGRDTTGAVGSGGAENALRADCMPGSLTLWSNGQRLVSIRDVTFTAGAIGLGVGNRKTGGMQALFKDFTIYEPEK